MDLIAIYSIERGKAADPSSVAPGEIFTATSQEVRDLLGMRAAREPSDDEVALLEAKGARKGGSAAQAAADQAAADAEARRIADEQAAAEAEAQRIAADQAAADAEAQRIADEQAAAEAEAQRVADEQAAAEAEAQRIAEEQAAEAAGAENKAAALTDREALEKRARDAKVTFRDSISDEKLLERVTAAEASDSSDLV